MSRVVRDQDWLYVDNFCTSTDRGEVGSIICSIDGSVLDAIDRLWPDDGLDHGLCFVGVRGKLTDIVSDLIEHADDEPGEARALAWANLLEFSAAQIRREIEERKVVFPVK